MLKAVKFAAFLFLLASFSYGEERGINVESAITRQLQLGKQYVFLIAIDKYSDWPNLKYPVGDAREIKDILQSRYDVDQVVELYDGDATKANILHRFSELQKSLQPEDSILIFYAGHGHFDQKVTNSGFWIPANGGTDVFEQANWIPNSQIRGIIGNFKASHIFLISDSCFSGDILNTMRGEALPEEINELNVAKAYALTSRQVITSGAEEAVPDNSEFTRQLKMALMKNTELYLDPLTLYAQIKKGVRVTLPLLGNLKETGHQEGASFYLFLKTKQENQSGDLTLHTPQTTPVEKPNVSGNRFFLDFEGGLLMPALDAEKLMGLGFGSALCIGYDISIPTGYIGFSFLLGIMNSTVQESSSSGYTMYSVPLGANVTYEFGPLPFLHIFLEAGGGEMLNILSYRNGYTPIVYAPFITGVLGGNFVFSPEWSVGVYGRCTAQFFSNIFSVNIMPGIQVKYYLR
jgi:hypothetical protein